MADQVINQLTELNQKELGDNKLSRQEIQYLQSKEKLWAKDVSGGLFTDIAYANVGLIQRDKTLKSFLDGLLTAETYLVPNILKEINLKSNLKLPDTYFYGFKNKTPGQQYFAVVNLLLLAANNKKAYFVSQINENEDLKKGIQTGTFNYSTLKALHAFQKQGEHVSGRSKADCLIGKRTIQQLLAKIGIKEITTTAVVDKKFASSNATAKNKYDWNIDQQKQMDTIINDKVLNDIEKVNEILEVAKKTVEIGSDNLNKKYGAVSYMLTRISDKLMVDQTKDETDQIISLLSGEEALIKKYWNVNAAREFGATNSSIQKTNNWIDDLQQRKETILTQRTRAFEMMTAYNSYLREISQDVGGIDWLSPLKKPLIQHCNQVDNLLSDFYYNRKNFDLDEVQRLIKFVFNDPMSKTLENRARNLQDTKPLKYTIKRKELMNLLSNPRAWSDETKGKFLNILREMDKYDDANRFLPVSYETTDVIKTSTQGDTDRAIFGKDGESEVDQQNLDLIKKDLKLINELFDVDKNGAYIHTQATDILNVIEASSTPQGGGDRPVRDVLKKAFPSLNTKDRIQRDFLGGNDYIDNLIKQIKEIKKNEKKTKNDIKKGFNATIQTLESLELAGTISNEGRTQLQNLRVNKDNLEPLVEKSYKEIVSNVVLSSIGHRFRKQVLDTYPNIFEMGSGSNVDLYANVVGAHRYLADDTVESLQNTIVQISIQLVIALASFGTANALLAAATGGTGVLARIFATSAGRGLVYRMLPFLTQTVFKTVAYTAVSSVATAGVYANDSSEIWGIIKQQRSPEAFLSNAAMMGILGGAQRLAAVGTALKAGQATTSFIVESGVGRFMARSSSNVVKRVVAEELSITLSQGGSKIFFGDGEFTTDDFIESVVQGLAFEMLPGVGELGKVITTKGNGKIRRDIEYSSNGKTYTNSPEEILKQIQKDNSNIDVKGEYEKNIKAAVSGKINEVPQKASNGRPKKYMPMERARNENTPQRTADDIQALRSKNLDKRLDLQKEVVRLENKHSDLLKQREANWRSLEGEGKGIENLNTILNKSNIITVDGVKYMYNGIKNGNAEFVEVVNTKKGQPKAKGNTLEVTSLEELLDPRFNLEPGNKATNQGRVNKLNDLFGTPQKLFVLNNKIATIKSKIDQLELDKTRLSKDPTNPAGNDYFNQNKSSLVNKDIWIDGNKYTCGSITESGDLNFKYTGGEKNFSGEKNFTVSSFAQLQAKGQVNGFSDGLANSGTIIAGSNVLKNTEMVNHKKLQEVFADEFTFLAKREANNNAAIQAKDADIRKLQDAKKELETELSRAQERDKQIKQRAEKGKEIQKELNRVSGELESARSQLNETVRLDKKYGKDLSELEPSKVEKQDIENKIDQELKKQQEDNMNIERQQLEDLKVEPEAPKVAPVEIAIPKTDQDLILTIQKAEAGAINYADIKLGWVTKSMMEAGIFLNGISKWAKSIKSAPSDFIRRLKEKVAEVKIKFQSNKNIDRATDIVKKDLDNIKPVENKVEAAKVEVAQKKAEEVADQKKAEEVADQNKQAENLVKRYEDCDKDIKGLENEKKLINEQIKTIERREKLEKELSDLDQIIGEYHHKLSEYRANGKPIVENYVAGDITQERNVSIDDFIKRLNDLEAQDYSKKNILNGLETITNSKQDLENSMKEIDEKIESSNRSKEEIKQDLNKIPGWNEISPTLSTPSSNGGALMTYMTPRQKLEIFKTNSEAGNNQIVSNNDVKADAVEVKSNNTSKKNQSNEVDPNPTVTNPIETINHDFSKKGEVKLQSQKIELDFANGAEYQITAGRQTFYINKSQDGSYTLRHASNEPNGELLLNSLQIQVGKEVDVGRSSFIEIKNDKFMAKNHFKISVSNDGKLNITDVSNANGTKVEKVEARNDNINAKSNNDLSEIDKNDKNTEVKNIEGVEGFYAMKKELEDNLVQELYPVGTNDINLSLLKGDVLKRFAAVYPPKYTLQYGGEKMYMTEKIVDKGGYKHLVGYTQSGEVRLFYRSGSEAEWRSTPGIRIDGGFSKAEGIKFSSYETTTKVDAEIGAILDSYTISTKSAPKSPIKFSKEVLKDNNISQDEIFEFNLPKMNTEIKITKMIEDLPNDAVEFYSNKTVKDAQKAYEDLKIDGLDLNNMTLSKEYSFNHDILGTKVNVQVMKMKWKGKDIDVHFAKSTDAPEKIFITNMVFSDAKLNSFLVYDNQLNAGPLVAKPIDYKRQAPQGANFTPYGNGKYMDIRDLYQETPLIKSYKQKQLKATTINV